MQNLNKDIESIEVFCKIAKNLKAIKDICKESSSYKEVWNLVADSYEAMAIHCDTSPDNLICGRIEQIKANL